MQRQTAWPGLPESTSHDTSSHGPAAGGASSALAKRDGLHSTHMPAGSPTLARNRRPRCPDTVLALAGLQPGRARNRWLPSTVKSRAPTASQAAPRRPTHPPKSRRPSRAATAGRAAAALASERRGAPRPLQLEQYRLVPPRRALPRVVRRHAAPHQRRPRGRGRAVAARRSGGGVAHGFGRGRRERPARALVWRVGLGAIGRVSTGGTKRAEMVSTRFQLGMCTMLSAQPRAGLHKVAAGRRAHKASTQCGCITWT